MLRRLTEYFRRVIAHQAPGFLFTNNGSRRGAAWLEVGDAVLGVVGIRGEKAHPAAF